jgi:amino acid adenylation domain-containing protein
VRLEALPLLPNGKLDRRALPAPDASSYFSQEYEAPQGETEQRIAGIWAEVLKLPVERIGRHDNFFAMGGQSISAVQLKVRLTDQLGYEIGIRSIFEHPTPHRLAVALGGSQVQMNETHPAVVPRGGAFPLSWVQQRLWLVQERDRDNAYNMGGTLTLEGPLSLTALETALQQLVERHEPLRTRFRVQAGDDEPQQYIDESATVDLVVREVPCEEVATLLRAHSEQVFDLAQGPLLGVLVLCLGPEEFVLSLMMHHIIADGWSLGILTRDMQELYAASLERRASLLPPLKIQYADYAAWQRKQDLSGALAYWTETLAGYPGPFDLAPESPRGQAAGTAGVVRRSVPAELAAALGRFSQERQASLFMVLLSGWALLVYRQTRQADLCLGTTVAGRELLALEPLIGFFINILALRLDLSGAPTGEQIVEQVRQVVLDGLAHQALPFEHLQEAVPGLRSFKGAAPLPVVLRHQNYPEADIQDWSGGLRAKTLPAAWTRASKGDLDVQYHGDANGLNVVVEYDTTRFSLQDIEELLEQVEELLSRLMEAPGVSLSRFLVPTAKEQAQLDQWNETTQIFEQTSVTELFARQAARQPEALACRDEKGALTFGELDRRSDNLARVLQEHGVGRDARVALYLPRSAEFLVALLAVFKARGLYVPVDASYPEAYAQRIIADAQPAVIVVESGFNRSLVNTAAKVLPLEESLWSEPHPVFEQGPAARAEDLAYIAYTSGTTGEPKGVCVEHGQLLNCLQALWTQIPFEADEVVVQKTATTFVVSVKELLAGLLVGVPQVIASDLLVRDTPAFAAMLEQHRVTRLNLVPSHLAGLLEYAEQLKSLRHVVTAGEPLPQKLRKRFESLLAGVKLYNNYGCTELNDITYCVPGEQESAGVMVPMGRPIADLRVHVLDEQQRVVPVGVIGELYVEGAAVGRRGYWNQAELNAARYLANPLEAAGSLLFRTGDQVRRLADGRLEYLGRNDFQIKIRGQRIDVGQVEQMLGEHPEVVSCAVMGHGSGSEEAILVAYYVAAPDAVLTHNQLYGWVRERLPGYMAPAAYVRLEALPLLPNGKLDRRALPAPDASSYFSQEYEEPQEETERRIAAIWAEVLKLPVERIGRYDNFFAVGGQSMIATQIVSGVAKHFNIELPLAMFFAAASLKEMSQVVQAIDIRTNRSELEALAMLNTLSEEEVDRLTTILNTESEISVQHPMPKDVAAISAKPLHLRERLLQLLLGKNQSNSLPRITPRPAGANVPLSYSQQRVWAFEKSRQGHTAYHIPVACRLAGAVDVPALRSAVAKLTERHEMLRTTFQIDAEGPIQKIADDITIHLDLHDLSFDHQSKREQMARSYIHTEMKRPFNLETGPLLRVSLIHLGFEEDILLVIVHHIAADGLSTNLLVRELLVFYDAVLSNVDSPLPTLPLQYGDYAYWQRQHMDNSPLLEEQESYWLRELAGAPLTTEMPIDRDRPSRALGNAQHLHSAISPSLFRDVGRLARKQEVTTFMIMLATLNVLIYLHTGQQDQVIGVQFANRRDSVLDPVVGTFHNFIPIRGQIRSTLTFSQWLDAVRKAALSASLNQDVPFSRIVDALKLTPSDYKSPLTQIAMTQVRSGFANRNLAGLSIQPFPLEEGYMAFRDLRVILHLNGDGMLINWEYATELFYKSTVARFAEHYEYLLSKIVADPFILIGDML